MKGRHAACCHCCISTICSHEKPGKFDVSVPCLFIVEKILIALNLSRHHSLGYFMPVGQFLHCEGFEGSVNCEC